MKEKSQETVLLFWCPEIKELFFYIQDHVCCFCPWQFDFNLSAGGKVCIFNAMHGVEKRGGNGL